MDVNEKDGGYPPDFALSSEMPSTAPDAPWLQLVRAEGVGLRLCARRECVHCSGTALHVAAIHGHAEMAELLLSHGANVNVHWRIKTRKGLVQRGCARCLRACACV